MKSPAMEEIKSLLGLEKMNITQKLRMIDLAFAFAQEKLDRYLEIRNELNIW
jgi:hypothetical protein